MAENIKLARASMNTVDPLSIQGTVTDDVDDMFVPRDFHKLIKTCRFFYKYDPLAGSVINKLVDCTISPIRNRRGNCTNEEFYVYDSLKTMLHNFYMNSCLEYLLSGMVVPEYGWDRVPGDQLSEKLNSRRRVFVPTNLWYRDPATVTLQRSPIPNLFYVYVTVDAELMRFIKSGGKTKDGTLDTETYKILVENYPDFVNAVMQSKGGALKIRLTDVRMILSRILPEDNYPIPYMTNSLESLMHKRNLRRMDYSIAARVIAAIQLIKLGDKDFPCTDDSDFDAIKTQMNYKTTKGNAERIYQLFANHTLKIEWVAPDTAAMLNREKYIEVDEDIVSGFGFPRTLITGESGRSNTGSGSSLATFSPLATMETIREKFIDWTIDLYKEIKEKNKFTHAAIPSFAPIKLYKLQELNEIGQMLYTEGTMSRTTRLEQFGLDLETEVERKKEEMEVYEKNKLPDAPTMPFSSPSIGKKTATEPVKPEPKKEEVEK